MNSSSVVCSYRIILWGAGFGARGHVAGRAQAHPCVALLETSLFQKVLQLDPRSQSGYYPSQSFIVLFRGRYSQKLIQREEIPVGGLLPATSRMPSAAQATGSLDQGWSSEAIADRKSAGADPPSAEKGGKPAGPSDRSGWQPAHGDFRGALLFTFVLMPGVNHVAGIHS